MKQGIKVTDEDTLDALKRAIVACHFDGDEGDPAGMVPDMSTVGLESYADPHVRAVFACKVTYQAREVGDEPPNEASWSTEEWEFLVGPVEGAGVELAARHVEDTEFQVWPPTVRDMGVTTFDLV